MIQIQWENKRMVVTMPLRNKPNINLIQNHTCKQVLDKVLIYSR